MSYQWNLVSWFQKFITRFMIRDNGGISRDTCNFLGEKCEEDQRQHLCCDIHIRHPLQNHHPWKLGDHLRFIHFCRILSHHQSLERFIGYSKSRDHHSHLSSERISSQLISTEWDRAAARVSRVTENSKFHLVPAAWDCTAPGSARAHSLLTVGCWSGAGLKRRSPGCLRDDLLYIYFSLIGSGDKVGFYQ